MKKYRIDITSGTYLYGNYSADNLNNEEVTDNIYFAVRNANEVVYVYKDASVNNSKSNVAKLSFYYKNGKVKKIIWNYDSE